MMKLVSVLISLILISLSGCWWLVLYLLMFTTVLFLCGGCGNKFVTIYSAGMGLDLVTYCMILLTLWIGVLMLMASLSIKFSNFGASYFVFIVVVLCLFLVLCFSVHNMFLFYVFFECSIIPTLFLVYGWGYHSERLIAGYYFLFYTLFASLPLLVSITYVYMVSGTLFFYLISLDLGFYMYLSLIVAFLVKMPMTFLHFWLPKAHVEAPISGSMILAGVLLKLGGYGLYRVFYFVGDYSVSYNFVFVSISMFGMVIIGILCLFQVDMKSLIAYSSVSHMAMVICGVFTLSTFGLYGSLLMMIGHGLCSSGLFCLANVVYERSHSRSFYLNSGLLTVMPSMCMFWFVFCANNMASPFSLNLMGEFMLINSVVSWSFTSLLFLMVSSFLSCACSVYLYSIIQYGSLSSGVLNFSSGSVREYYLLVLHFIPLNLIFLSVDLLTYML